MRNTSRLFFSLVLGLCLAGFLLLTACGQKGTLFIPADDEQSLDKPQTETPKTTKNS